MAGRARKTAVETEDINLADFDLDAWIDGTTGIQGCAKIIQRGELLAQMERLDQELRVARRIPEDQRGVADRDPDTIQAEIERVAEQIWDSVLWVYVQDRTQARREKLAKELQKKGKTDDEIGYHLLADAIIRVETSDGKVVPLPPAGFPPAKLMAIRDRLGDSGLAELVSVYKQVTSAAPAVRAPLSRGSSLRRGGIT